MLTGYSCSSGSVKLYLGTVMFWHDCLCQHATMLSITRQQHQCLTGIISCEGNLVSRNKKTSGDCLSGRFFFSLMHQVDLKMDNTSLNKYGVMSSPILKLSSWGPSSHFIGIIYMCDYSTGYLNLNMCILYL